MTPRPWILAESTWATTSTAQFEVAVLPWGATEAHNRHLPYATDTIEAESVAIEAARQANDKGARVVVLPAVPFGVQTGQREVPFCLNMNPSTQAALLGDLIASIEPHGVRKLVIMNGHGGNDFRQIIRELQLRTRMVLCQVNWYAAVPARDFFAEPGDHAGELETSVMMHLAPGLTAPLSSAGPGKTRPFVIAGLREGWAWTPRHWIEATDDTGVGNPGQATADKGQRFVAAAAERIGQFLAELSSADPARLYQE